MGFGIQDYLSGSPYTGYGAAFSGGAGGAQPDQTRQQALESLKKYYGGTYGAAPRPRVPSGPNPNISMGLGGLAQFLSGVPVYGQLAALGASQYQQRG